MTTRVNSITSAAVLLGALALLAAGAARVPPSEATSSTPDAKLVDSKTASKFTMETLRGRVVWLDEALARKFGVSTEPAAAQSAVALETADGELLPIILDTRGRAFAVDERLRNIDVELFVRRYAGVPMIQVLRTFHVAADGLYELDYWCDVCAISMAILKDCECCQGPTRLREQRVDATTIDVSP